MQLCHIPKSYKAPDANSYKFMKIMNNFIFVCNKTKVNKELIDTSMSFKLYEILISILKAMNMAILVV